ncbi:MAG: Rid family hydrolase, partial [Opitutaceae bacterium]
FAQLGDLPNDVPQKPLFPLPPPPVFLSAAEQQRTFRLAPGFQIELVADETVAAAVRVADGALAYTGQIFPGEDDGRMPRDAGAQALQVLARLDRTLAAADSSLAMAVKINFYLASDDAFAAVEAALAEKCRAAPAAVSYMRSTLAVNGALVAADAVAAAPSVATNVRVFSATSPSGGSGTGKSIAVLPAGRRVYVSGLVSERARGSSDLRSATREAMARHGEVLAFLGLRKTDVVQVKAFFRPPAARAELAEEIAAFFAEGAVPPIIEVEFRSASYPAEIELVAAGGAMLAGGREPLTFITPPGMTATRYWSRVVTVEPGVPQIYFSAFFGEGANSPREEMRMIFSRLGEALFDHGSSFRWLVKGTYYNTNSEISRALREARDVYYDPTRLPGSSAVQTTGVGRPGSTGTVDIIAVPLPAPVPPRE